MSPEERLALIRSIADEINTEPDLLELLKQNRRLLAYDGFEPSGQATLPVGLYLPIRIRVLSQAGVDFKLLLADTFAWINNKMGGDLEKIREAGRYFMEVWKAAGIDMNKVEVIWHKNFFDDPEYWRKVMVIARNHTMTRTKRSLTIAGRREGDDQSTAFFFYPSMQCADIFQIKADICQLGRDQRKVNMLAREIADAQDQLTREKLSKLLKYEGGVNGKPVVISHHMLPKLSGPAEASGFDEDAEIDRQISSKMSKSDPRSAIIIHDSAGEIRAKIEGAFCPPRVADGNPVIEYAKEIIFRSFKEVQILRPQKFGGNATYFSFAELKRDYVSGQLHPIDLKNGVIEYLDKLISPIRNHFETNKRAKQLLETIKSYEITR